MRLVVCCAISMQQPPPIFALERTCAFGATDSQLRRGLWEGHLGIEAYLLVANDQHVLPRIIDLYSQLSLETAKAWKQLTKDDICESVPSATTAKT